MPRGAGATWCCFPSCGPPATTWSIGSSIPPRHARVCARDWCTVLRAGEIGKRTFGAGGSGVAHARGEGCAGGRSASGGGAKVVGGGGTRAAVVPADIDRALVAEERKRIRGFKDRRPEK